MATKQKLVRLERSIARWVPSQHFLLCFCSKSRVLLKKRPGASLFQKFQFAIIDVRLKKMSNYDPWKPEAAVAEAAMQ